MHGGNQDVTFTSTPSQAKVTVDGVNRGVTPVVVKLSRKNEHVVKLELDGYAPYETVLTKTVSGWVWGNVVFGGLVGLAVDAGTGGLYKLPNAVNGSMAQATQAGSPRPKDDEQASAERSGIIVHVVKAADPSWQKVGSLTRE